MNNCQPADHTAFATNKDAAANSLALELYRYGNQRLLALAMATLAPYFLIT